MFEIEQVCMNKMDLALITNTGWYAKKPNRILNRENFEVWSWINTLLHPFGMGILLFWKLFDLCFMVYQPLSVTDYKVLFTHTHTHTHTDTHTHTQYNLMQTQTRLSRHNKFISAENVIILSVSSDDYSQSSKCRVTVQKIK